MSTASVFLDAPDTDLIDLARTGDVEAFGELWRRHYSAALRVARSFAPRASDAEAMVAEAHAMIFQRLLDGRVASPVFRSWLYLTIRHIADPEHVVSPDDDVEPSPEPGPAGLTARAFQGLPDRWRSVLWYTRVERMDYSRTALILGMTAPAVAALATRAEEGFQAAWLQAHVVDAGLDEECRWTMVRLGRASRDALDDDDRMRLELHLLGCSRCSIVSDETGEISVHLALVMLPLTLGAIVGGMVLANLTASAAAAAPALPASVAAIAAHHTAAAATAASAAGAGSVAAGSASVAGVAAGMHSALVPALVGGATVVAVALGIAVAASVPHQAVLASSAHHSTASADSSSTGEPSATASSASGSASSAPSVDSSTASDDSGTSASQSAESPSSDSAVPAPATSSAPVPATPTTIASTTTSPAPAPTTPASTPAPVSPSPVTVVTPTPVSTPVSAPTPVSTPTPTPVVTSAPVVTSIPAPVSTPAPVTTSGPSASPAAAPAATRTITLAGTATPLCHVTVKAGSTVLGVVKVALNGKWSATVSVPTTVTSVSVTQGAIAPLAKLIPVRVTTTGGLTIL